MRAAEARPMEDEGVHAKGFAGLVLSVAPMLVMAGLGAAQSTRLIDAARSADSTGVTIMLEQVCLRGNPTGAGRERPTLGCPLEP